MGPIKAAITMAGGYAMVKAAAGAVEKHDANKRQYQQQQGPPQQQYNQQQQSMNRNAGSPGQSYGKYVAPDGREYPVYEPQPQFEGMYEPVQRRLGQESASQQDSPYGQGQRDSHQGSRSLQPYQEGAYQHPAPTTPPPYQSDRKN